MSSSNHQSSGLDLDNIDIDYFLNPHTAQNLQDDTIVGSLPVKGTGLNEYGSKIPDQLSSSYSVGPSLDSASLPTNRVRSPLARNVQSKNAGRSTKNRPKLTLGSSAQPVDRKRRDNINEKIQELLTLIPKEFFANSRDKEKSSGTKDGKPNKGQILTKSVDYINWLQQKIDENNRKEVELSIKLRNMEIAKNVPVQQRMNLLHTSAEIGLSKIGVGPLAEQEAEKGSPRK